MSNSYSIPPSENKAKESATQALFGVTLGVIAMFGIAISCINGSDPEPEKFALFMCGVLLGSIYVFMGLVEVTLMHRLMNLKSSLLLWAFFVACLGYVARTRASVDINRIFHMEASAFPMTLAATTLLHMISILFWFFIISGFVCNLLVVSSVLQGSHHGKGLMLIVCQVVTGISFITMAGFSHFRIDRESSRDQMIYRIAHAVDFNAYSPCANIDSATKSMVFLDADKRLALIAPVLDEFITFEWRKVSFLRSVAVPESFETITCEYAASSKNSAAVWAH